MHEFNLNWCKKTDEFQWLFLSYFYSTDSGWDNPFRPDGDLSREADEIVNMIKGKDHFMIFI